MHGRKIIFTFLVGVAAAAAASAQAPLNNGPTVGRVTRSANRPMGVVSPVPSQLRNGHTVFLSNAGADAGLFPHPFSGTQDRAYGYVFSALQKDGRFTLVGTPQEADLVFELRLDAPEGSVSGNKQQGTEDALPTFRLTIFDRPSHYVLWTLSQTVYKANLQKTHDKNFEESLDLLLTELKTVAKPD